MSRRAFPVVYTARVGELAEFYGRLGFVAHHRVPAEGTPAFVALRRGTAEIAVCEPPPGHGGAGPRGRDGWRMFVFVDELDAVVGRLADAGVPVIEEPADTPWGERVALVGDPDGNHVALASSAVAGGTPGN